jgi:gluconokinase
MSQYVIGLDLGTTNSKAVCLDAHSQVIAIASSAHAMRSPKPGWAVQDASSVWSSALSALKELSQQIPARQVAGICLSGAMQSLLPVDKHYQPLALAMTWADNRSAVQARRLNQMGERRDLLQRVGCPLQHVYNPARLRWWLEEAPEITIQTEKFTAIKDFILYQLSGRLATDVGLASTTGMLDIHQLAWDAEAVTISGVNINQLPDLVRPNEIVGGLVREVSAITGFPEGLPVIAGTSDGGLANLGSGAVSPGDRIVTVGTSGAVRKIVDQPWVDPLGRTWCYALMNGRWFAGGAINNGGLTMQWVREKFYSDVPGDGGYQTMFEEAAAVTPGAEGVMMLPYLTGERSPYWDPDATAVILGLGLQHSRSHIARAAMEGVAYCLANIWEVLHGSLRDGGKPVFLTGGISRNPVWSQIVADVLGVPMRSVEAADASAVGAAMVGHLALGNVSSLEEIAQNIREGAKIEFSPLNHAFYAEQHLRFKQIYASFVNRQELERTAK